MKLTNIYIVILAFLLCSECSFSQSGWLVSSAGSSVLTKIQFFNQSTGLCVSLDGVVYKSTNGGANWTNYYSVSSAFVHSGQFFDLCNYVLVGTNNFHTNGWVGIVRDNLFTPYLFAPVLGNLFFVSTFWQNRDTGFAAGTDTDLNTSVGRIHKTTNGGINWSNVTPDSTSNINCINFTNSITGYLVDPYFKKTTNSGTNWFGMGLPFMPVNDISPYNSDTIYMCGLHGKIYFSSTGGAIWTERPAGADITLERIKFADSKTGWVCGDSGYIYRTTNAGTNWMRQTSGTNNHLYDICLLNNNYLWICGANGVVLRTTNGGVTFIHEFSEKTSEAFALGQNYPNPFNQSTIFVLRCSKPGNVSVKIFDISGKDVSTLINNFLGAGTYKLLFDGAGLASGIYYYIMNVDGINVTTKKMVMVK